MKTSNKLISLGLLIFVIGLTSFIVAAKSAMIDKVEKLENDILDELGNLKEISEGEIVERSLGKLLANKLDLDGNHRYILDPSNDDVIVVGKSKYINDFELLTDSMLFDAQIFHEVTSKRDELNDSEVFARITDTLYYRIGIKGKRDLLLLIGDESKVTTTELVELSTLKIVMDGTSHIDAKLKCDKLEMTTRNNAHARLKGLAGSVSITSYDNSNLDCGELSSQLVDLLMSDNSRVALGANKEISGVLRNNANYNNHGFANGKKVLVKDNAKFN